MVSLAALLAGCATNRAYVSLHYTPDVADYSREYGPQRLFVTQIVDRRVKLEPGQLGVIRDKEGAPTGTIMLLREQAPADKLTEDIALLLQAAGVEVKRIPATAELSAAQRRSVDAILSGEVRHFELVSDDRAMGVVSGRTEIYLQMVQPVTGLVIWSSTFTNSSERSAQISLSRAREAVAKEIHAQLLTDLTRALPLALGRVRASQTEEAF